MNELACAVKYHQAREMNYTPLPFVYAIWQPCICFNHMWVKIGTSRNPWYRWETLSRDSLRGNRKDTHWPESLCSYLPMELRYLMPGGHRTETAMRRLLAETFDVTDKRGEWLSIPCKPSESDPKPSDPADCEDHLDIAHDWVEDCPQDVALEQWFRCFGGHIAPWFPNSSMVYNCSSLEDTRITITLDRPSA